jgi:hypothetical protein
MFRLCWRQSINSTTPTNKQQESIYKLKNKIHNSDVENQLQNLKLKLKKSEDANNILTLRYEEAVLECEENHSKIEQLENKVIVCEKVFEKAEDLKKSVEILVLSLTK